MLVQREISHRHSLTMLTAELEPFSLLVPGVNF
jgi:hypothetical protein